MSGSNWLPADRIGVLNTVCGWLIVLVVVRAVVPWTVVPPLLWSVLVAVAALHLIVSADRIGRLPVVHPGARAVPRTAGVVVQLVLAAALLIGSIR